MLRTINRIGLFAKPCLSYNPYLEEVLIVDESNNPIGSTTRSSMREQKLLFRMTYVYILNPENKLFVQKRTATKDVFPGFYDVATGGIVLASDSSDHDSALRELNEEMGIKTASLEFCFNYFHAQRLVWCAVFLTHWDKEVILQPEEVQWVELMSVSEVFERSRTENFTPSVEGLRILCNHGKIDI